VHTAAPEWLHAVLGTPDLHEGATVEIAGQPFVVRDGIPRARNLVEGSQAQTRDAFGFKWKKRDTFESPASLARMRAWLFERYGDVGRASWLAEYGESPLLLDAGCGAGMSALELFRPCLSRVRYLGVDVSDAVETARDRFREQGFDAAFLQADLGALPLAPGSVDLMFSEGVLHHTNSTERALKSLAPLLKPGGRLLFYVYRQKGPLREFADDLVREKLRDLSPEDAWRAMEPLTRLGISLGELDVEIDIPEPIDLLGIPAGRISVQRLFYWHVAKAFYRPDLSFDEMNHINFDWYAPANAHRQTPEQVLAWCAEAGLVPERTVVQESGITVIARKV
jgi:SAM-dependent methyltransferase